MIGGGMDDFKDTCWFPCLCKGCRSVEQVNVLAKPPVCPRCKSEEVIPYDWPEACGKRGKHEIAGWNVVDLLGRDLHLTDGTYLCPRCDRMTLRFEDTGLCWD